MVWVWPDALDIDTHIPMNNKALSFLRLVDLNLKMLFPNKIIFIWRMLKSFNGVIYQLQTFVVLNLYFLHRFICPNSMEVCLIPVRDSHHFLN